MVFISELGGLTKIDTLGLVANAKRILLVRGGESYRSSGAEKIINQKLQFAFVFEYFGFEANPKSLDVAIGGKIANELRPDLIVGIGGGSVMDMAKLIKACAACPALADQIIVDNSDEGLLDVPLVLVPTTAGTGSEVTEFAVAYVKGKKYSVSNPMLRPNAVILDGNLAVSNTPYQIACNGLDAIAQAVESYWAKGATSESKTYAIAALNIGLETLPALLDPSADNATFQMMLEASCLAGMAINISKTTAPHAWSYGFTSELGVPHGHAVWLTLPQVFQVHALSNLGSGRETRLESEMNDLMAIFGIPEPCHAAHHLKSFVKSLGVEPDFARVGAADRRFRAKLAGMINQERMTNNPVDFTPEQVKQIFSL